MLAPLAYDLATKPVEKPMSKFIQLMGLYMALAVLMGQLLPIMIDSTLAYIIVGILSTLFLFPWYKARQITKAWTAIRGIRIEANIAARGAFREKKGYVLDAVPFVLIVSFLLLVYYATLGLVPVAMVIMISGLPLLMSFLDWKHDVVFAREFKRSRRKEMCDGVDIILDWPGIQLKFN